MEAYLEFPPAQIFPATRGITYRERFRRAVVTRSGDGNEVLFDGMPRSILGEGEAV